MAEPHPDDTRMPFLEHLRELRDRLRNAIIALLVGTVVAFLFKQELFVRLARPLVAAWERRLAANPDLGQATFNFGDLIEPFWTYFSISIWAGIFIASPFMFHQLWKFVAPGLYSHERRMALPFALFSGLFFIGGAAFCYFLVLPVAFNFFLGYADSNLASMHSSLGLQYDLGQNIALRPTLFMQDYLDLTKKFLLGFGVIFELPLLIFFLSWIGLVTHRSLWRFNRWAIVLSFVIGAILTPGPDIASQLLMAIPMAALYNLSILVAFVVTRRREKKQRQEAGGGEGGEGGEGGSG
jgi:sec-independent protein translocase protein TatC